jgi:hypothetical protein
MSVNGGGARRSKAHLESSVSLYSSSAVAYDAWPMLPSAGGAKQPANTFHQVRRPGGGR